MPLQAGQLFPTLSDHLLWLSNFSCFVFQGLRRTNSKTRMTFVAFRQDKDRYSAFWMLWLELAEVLAMDQTLPLDWADSDAKTGFQPGRGQILVSLAFYIRQESQSSRQRATWTMGNVFIGGLLVHIAIPPASVSHSFVLVLCSISQGMFWNHPAHLSTKDDGDLQSLARNQGRLLPRSWKSRHWSCTKFGVASALHKRSWPKTVTGAFGRANSWSVGQESDADRQTLKIAQDMTHFWNFASFLIQRTLHAK